jgi:hypothetical protein
MTAFRCGARVSIQAEEKKLLEKTCNRAVSCKAFFDGAGRFDTLF